MMSQNITKIAVVLIALAVVLTPGCQMAQEVGQQMEHEFGQWGQQLGIVEKPAPRTTWPITQRQYEPYRDEARNEPPGKFTFLGDNPRYDNVPFENRSVVNVSRHTFTTDGRDFDPHIDPKGENMVFASTRNSRHPDVYIKRVEGTALQQLTSDPASDIQPKFSPDGSKVVFASNRSGNWDIWMVDRDGMQPVQLTHNLGDEIAPTWSPEGDKVAFTLWSPQGRRWEIWTLELDQPGKRRFLTYGMFPEWSPKGDKIAFQRSRERGTRWYSVWTIDVVNDEAIRPTEIAHRPKAACISPTWSPDGSMLCYSTIKAIAPPINPNAKKGDPAPRPRMHGELWVVGLETGNCMKLADDSAPSFNPVWSPDNRVYFVSSRDGVENVWSCTVKVNEYESPNSNVASGTQANRAVIASEPAPFNE